MAYKDLPVIVVFSVYLFLLRSSAPTTPAAHSRCTIFIKLLHATNVDLGFLFRGTLTGASFALIR